MSKYLPTPSYLWPCRSVSPRCAAWLHRGTVRNLSTLAGRARWCWILSSTSVLESKSGRIQHALSEARSVVVCGWFHHGNRQKKQVQEWCTGLLMAEWVMRTLLLRCMKFIHFRCFSVSKSAAESSPWGEKGAVNGFPWWVMLPKRRLVDSIKPEIGSIVLLWENFENYMIRWSWVWFAKHAFHCVRWDAKWTMWVFRTVNQHFISDPLTITLLGTWPWQEALLSSGQKCEEME